MNPHIIKLLLKGHKEKIKELDYLAWIFNQYTLSAVSVAVEHCLAGKKARSEYIGKPIMQEIEKDNRTLTEEEKQRAVDLFFAQEKARRINWRRNHPRNGSVS